MKDVRMNRHSYWFPAKTYGWGWGLPLTWQGWVVLALFVMGIALLPVLVKPSEDPLVFFGSIVALTLALTAICWKTGEPPRWRWGKP